MTNKKKNVKGQSSKVNYLVVRKKGLHVLGLIFRYTLLVSMSMIIISPLYLALKDAITSQDVAGMQNSFWIPPKTSLQSVTTAWYILDYGKSLISTVLQALVMSLLQTVSAAMAAYTFSRLKFKGSNLLFGLVVFTIIVPPQSIMLSQYDVMRNFDIFGLIKLFTGDHLNLLNTSWGIFLFCASGVGLKGGVYIYLLRQACRQLPTSIEEAAYVDGAGFLKTFVKIVIPGISSTLIAVMVLSFVWNYADNYYVSLLSTNSKYLAVQMVYVQEGMNQHIRNVSNLMPAKYIVDTESPYIQNSVASACATMIIAPLVVFYMFIQKRFVQGVERSGLGGE